jgi:Ca2+-transporting ATPase
MMSAEWFKQDTSEVLQRLKTDTDRGLSAEEAAQRLGSVGANELEEAEKRSTLRLFLEQFSNPLLIILLVGAAVSLYAGHVVDAIAIAAIVIINALISFAQEFKAQKSMDALKEMAAPDAMVRRNGEWISIPARELVPGEVLRLNT